MGWNEWVGIENLKAIVRHTFHCSFAMASFILISKLVSWGIENELLRTIIGAVDAFTLVVLFLVFLINIGYDLLKETLKNVRSHQLVLS
jgi:hypothetical protein